MITKFNKFVTCENCETTREYAFDCGTDLRNKKVECAHCGLPTFIRVQDRAAVTKAKRPNEPWDFMRDFFGIKGGK